MIRNLAIFNFWVWFLLLIDVVSIEAFLSLIFRMNILKNLSWELSIDSIIVSEFMIILHKHGLVLNSIINIYIPECITFVTLIRNRWMSVRLA